MFKPFKTLRETLESQNNAVTALRSLFIAYKSMEKDSQAERVWREILTIQREIDDLKDEIENELRSLRENISG